MKDFFKVSGTSDEAMDSLNSVVKKGARLVQQSFTSYVGIGSREHYLLGAIIVEHVTSSTVENHQFTRRCLRYDGRWHVDS